MSLYHRQHSRRCRHGGRVVLYHGDQHEPQQRRITHNLLACFVRVVVVAVALEAVESDRFGGSSGRSGTVPITLGITVENELAVR